MPMLLRDFALFSFAVVLIAGRALPSAGALGCSGPGNDRDDYT